MKKLKINALFLFIFLFNTIIHASDITQIDNDSLKALTPVQKLGQQLFFDKNLSSPAGQACASCHDPKAAFTDANFNMPVSDGIVAGRTGTRNAPTAMYMAFSPVFHLEKTDTASVYIGGQFLDGRASNLSEQAKGPFLNPDEMNNQDEAEVVGKLRTAAYADLFKQVYGDKALEDVKQAYQNMADAVAQFENTATFHPFSSKYDYYLAGEVELTAQEKMGLEIFNDEQKGNCAACHPSVSETATPPLFTDFSYDNLGVPSNPIILNKKGNTFVDLGLGKVLNDARENGKFKVPTLRNVAKTAPYMHNGLFTNLRDAVEFYSTRDVDAKWGKPEVAENMNKEELGDLKLTPDEIDAVVAFLKTLTDGYVANDMPSYLASAGVITIPQIKVEGRATKTIYARAVLKKVEGSNANLYCLEYTDLKTTANPHSSGMPRYSVDNKLLEIPLLKEKGGANSTVQFKHSADNVFELIYKKPLQ